MLLGRSLCPLLLAGGADKYLLRCCLAAGDVAPHHASCLCGDGRLVPGGLLLRGVLLVKQVASSELQPPAVAATASGSVSVSSVKMPTASVFKTSKLDAGATDLRMLQQYLLCWACCRSVRCQSLNQCIESSWCLCDGGASLVECNVSKCSCCLRMRCSGLAVLQSSHQQLQGSCCRCHGCHRATASMVLPHCSYGQVLRCIRQGTGDYSHSGLKASLGATAACASLCQQLCLRLSSSYKVT